MPAWAPQHGADLVAWLTAVAEPSFDLSHCTQAQDGTAAVAMNDMAACPENRAPACNLHQSIKTSKLPYDSATVHYAAIKPSHCPLLPYCSVLTQQQTVGVTTDHKKNCRGGCVRGMQLTSARLVAARSRTPSRPSNPSSSVSS